MRQLILKVPAGHQQDVDEAAEKFNGKNTITLAGNDSDVFILFLPNQSVNNFLGELSHIEEMEVNLIPRGVISLYPPKSDSPDQVADVQPKSSLEIYLGGIQSVGSVFGLLGYSFTAGIIVWIGLYISTSYLLVAAMLIAPFAGPAMNAALGTASGQWPLIQSSLKRYAMAILTGIFASFILTAAFNLQTLTPLMTQVSQVSKVAVFLPLIAGFAGAINVCQSERDSLVSGAAVGILVAASLAPPVGLLGVGLYLWDTEIIFSSIFRIILQLLGIHLAATLVFYFYGKVSTQGIRFLQGNKLVQRLATALVIAGIGLMMIWQFSQPPFLRKASMKTELTEAFNAELKMIPHLQIIDNQVTFTNRKFKNTPVVNFSATVLPFDTLASDSAVKAGVIRQLKTNLHFPEWNIYKVYNIEVVKD